MHGKINKPRDKPYFCYDINLEFHELIKACNQHARFIGSVRLTHNPEAKDRDIVNQCRPISTLLRNLLGPAGALFRAFAACLLQSFQSKTTCLKRLNNFR